MEVRVLNNSSVENIYATFKNAEDANIPEPPATSISPGSFAQMPVSAATMNLFVWSDPSLDPIWSGAVPTKVQNSIVVSPEKKEVSYDGVTLPSGFSPVTDPQRLTVGQLTNNSDIWSTLLITLLVLIVLLVIIYFFWWKK
jgi:hypothetical protein